LNGNVAALIDAGTWKELEAVAHVRYCVTMIRINECQPVAFVSRRESMTETVNRRTFLKHGAVLGAGITILKSGILKAGNSPNEKLNWDARNLKAANCPEADKFIRKQYRQGWVLNS
jgi:hypothetical protein